MQKSLRLIDEDDSVGASEQVKHQPDKTLHTVTLLIHRRKGRNPIQVFLRRWHHVFGWWRWLSEAQVQTISGEPVQKQWLAKSTDADVTKLVLQVRILIQN